MRIRSVRAIPLLVSFERIWGGADKVPQSVLAPAAHFQKIPRSGQFSTIVVVESDEGATGLGEAFGLPYSPVTADLISGVVAPAVKGRSFERPADVQADLYKYFSSMGHTRGFAIEALSGLDIALWDLLARDAGRPLAEYLGGSLKPIPLYVSPVPFLDRPEESGARAADFVRQGFKAVKLKIGRGVATDVEHTAAVRDAVGAGIPVMLDANCAYDVPTAISLARALDGLDVAWLEEPIYPDAPEDLAAVRRAAPMPVAAGENEFLLRRFEDFVRADSVDVFQPNITRCGGVTGMMAIGELSARHGIGMAPHGVGSGIGVAATLHTCCAAQGFTVYEANRLPNPLRDDLPLEQPAIEDGCYVLSDRPGHGCDFDWDLANSYAIAADDRAHFRARDAVPAS